MPTAVVLNGHVYWSRAPRVVRMAVPHYAIPDAPEIPALSLPKDYVEDENGVRYRIVAKIEHTEGWVTIDAIMRWYGVAKPDVILWAKRGFLDCAAERDSALRFYRVLNPDVLKANMPEKKEKKPVQRPLTPWKRVKK